MGATEDAAARSVIAGQKPKGVAGWGATPGAWVLAVALPIVMVHVDFQPGFTVTAGSTHAHIVLSDLAVAAVLVAAIATAVAHGLGRLRYGVPAWIAIALFLG